MDYDAAKRRLTIGRGYVENVTPEMPTKSPACRCSGIGSATIAATGAARSSATVARLRRSTRIQPDHWLPEYTSDLIDLLHVLGRLIALDPAQADLLNRICAGPLRSAEELRDVGALALPEVAGAPKRKRIAEK